LDKAADFAFRKAPGAVKPKGTSNENGYDGSTNAAGLREGKGKQTFTDGSFYQGFWKNDKCQYRGRMVFANGDMYTGAWKENKPNDDKGEYVFAATK